MRAASKSKAPLTGSRDTLEDAEGRERAALARARHAVPAQFFRYLLVGAPAFAADALVLTLVIELGRLDVVIAAVIGSIAGTLVNYALCVRWVFPARRGLDSRVELALFFAIGLTGLGINAEVIGLLAKGLGVHYLAAKIVAAILVLFWTFSVRRLALFRARS